MLLVKPWSRFLQIGKPMPLVEFHRHNDIELTLLRSGHLTYEMNGRRVAFSAGCLCLFWGGIPHRWVDWSERIDLQVICLPMPFVARMKPADAFLRQLLSGRVFMESDETRSAVDDSLMRDWNENLANGDRELQEIVEVEIEGRLRRMAHNQSPRRRSPIRRGGEDALSRLLGAVCDGATEGCPVTELSRRAGLHPKYAMRLFRRECGTSLLKYLHQLRISHAQRLLLTTDLRITDIALESGFGSAAQFHEVFKSLTHSTPSALRRSGSSPGWQ